MSVTGTHGIFACNHGEVKMSLSEVSGASRAGISCFSGARVHVQDSRILNNGENGVAVCGWSIDKVNDST